jgi:heme/copper-type cytochrome/quinol oxidase subunit 4
MKTYSEFQNFCSVNLNSNFNKIAELRKSVVNKLILYRIVLVLMIVGFIAFLTEVETIFDAVQSNTFLLIISVIALIVYIIFFLYLYGVQSDIKDDFVTEFKLNLIQNIVKFFDDSLVYKPDNCISQNDFKSSGLFPQKIDKYEGDDYVEGVIGQTKIRFSEIHAFIEESSGNNKKQYEEIFSGIFFIGDFNKNFNGKTIIMPDNMEKHFGRFAKFMQGLIHAYGELIKLEDVEFENEFVVYSNDQIESRYILSTSLMQRILNFKKKANSHIMMSFVNSQIYIAIPLRGKLFEPKIFGKLLDEKTLKQYFEHLEITLSSVEELNLNLRIWSKN